MKYFIDFEAQQFSNYIISIGCVRENGDEFYSLVKSASKKNKKVTKFITDLTGITNEMLANAPTPDEVFANLFDWCTENDEMPEFLCYGNCDADFVKANFEKATNFKAKAMLGFIYAGLKDYAPTVKAHFGLIKLIGLAKVADYYRGYEIEQNHNSLEDAKLLKYVYEQLQIHTSAEDSTAFPDYKTEIANRVVVIGSDVKYVDYKITCFTNKKRTDKVKDFEGVMEVLDYFVEKFPKGMTGVKMENIAKRIKAAHNANNRYMNFYWTMEAR